MDLSIIIVSWNVKEKLKANLKALYDSESNFKFEVFVVDNNSHDGSVAMIRQNFPQVNLIANQENFGFAKANNQAIALATGQYILLLNPDMQVKADTLMQMKSFVENHPQATVSGCKLIDEKDNIVKQIRNFPTLFDQLMIVIKLPHLFPGVIRKYLCADFDYSVSSKVDSIRGAFFLINCRNFQKISGQTRPFLDERYFIWFEEVDFCKQVYKFGGEVWYNSTCTCLDYVGQSFGQVKRVQAQNYFRSSMLEYFKKWGRPCEVKILKLAWRLIGLFVR